ncbi:MAG TPA: hypothetical protein VGN55_18080 [Xanthobacteraceae bacterium]|jgi:hypothetical protein
MWLVARITGICIGSLCVYGCASSQLNTNTLDLASTVGDLQTRQILFNLSLVLDNPGAIPTHVDLSGGNASTTNSITPTAGSPLNDAIGSVGQVTKTVANTVTTATQSQSTASRASGTVGISASDAWSQSWSYNPVIDGDELRRLRSLYRYALGQFDNEDLVDEYPLVQKPQTITFVTGNGSSPPPIENDSIYCPDIGLTRMMPTKGQIGAPAGCASVTTNIQIPDERYLHEPGCILCLKRHALYTKTSIPWINKRLTALHGRWLLTERNELPTDVIFLGHYGYHDLYITPQDRPKLSEFTLFVLTATAQSAAANPSGGSQGKKPSSGSGLFLDQFGNPFLQVQ